MLYKIYCYLNKFEYFDVNIVILISTFQFIEPYQSIGKGQCLYGSDDAEFFAGTGVSSVMECYDECKQTTGCSAFAFRSSTGACVKYRDGPYTYTDGRSHFECYLLGISNLFNAVVRMKFLNVNIMCPP